MKGKEKKKCSVACEVSSFVKLLFYFFFFFDMSTQKKMEKRFELVTLTSLGVLHSRLNYLLETSNYSFKVYQLSNFFLRFTHRYQMTLGIIFVNLFFYISDIHVATMSFLIKSKHMFNNHNKQDYFRCTLHSMLHVSYNLKKKKKKSDM